MNNPFRHTSIFFVLQVAANAGNHRKGLTNSFPIFSLTVLEGFKLKVQILQPELLRGCWIGCEKMDACTSINAPLKLKCLKHSVISEIGEGERVMTGRLLAFPKRLG